METTERKGRILAMCVILFIVFWSQCKGVESKNSLRMSYLCPPHFMRLGHSCYYFSDSKVTWQNALFACKDKDSNLSVPLRWEDRNLRNYLNTHDVEKSSRWIGGIYDYSVKQWRWGGDLRPMPYQSFSKMKKLAPEELQWHCIAMMPELLYRWAPRSCLEPRQYICQTKLLKVPKQQVKEYQKRWESMGKINEITVPSISHEAGHLKTNDIPTDQFAYPKSYDLGPNQLRDDPNALSPRPITKPLRKRGRRPTVNRRLKKPFPGYRWDRRDPEGSYQRNAAILRSGKTGLKPHAVRSQLARLRHLRNRQLRRREQEDWLVNDEKPIILARSNARTYTMDNNISALHPKTIVEEFDMPPPQVLARPNRGIA